jgi:hypothetical protein
MVSRADAAAYPRQPGKKEANELLKKCRMAIPYGKEYVGQIVHFKDVVSEFCWQGWLAGQAQAADIFKSKMNGKGSGATDGNTDGGTIMSIYPSGSSLASDCT